MWTHPAVVGCGVAGRDHPSHPRRRLGEQPVSGLDGAGPGNRDNSASGAGPELSRFPGPAPLGWRHWSRCPSNIDVTGVSIMRISFELAAEFRDAEGKGASRRLRHAGRVPAILYGGHKEPRAITLNHQKLMTLVDNEKFYSSIINLKVGDVTQAAIVKDLQMHPARNAIVHVDLQRVVESEKIRIHIPIHFKGEAASPGVKTQGGVVSHRVADVEISCLPKDLPEFIELDLSQMALNESKHLSDLP